MYDEVGYGKKILQRGKKWGHGLSKDRRRAKSLDRKMISRDRIEKMRGKII